MISFAKTVKKELATVGTKLKNCCIYSFIYGILFCAKKQGDFYKIKCLNKDVGALFQYLCEELSLSKRFFCAYEKNSIVIADGFLRANSYADIKNTIFKCGRCKEYFFRGLFLSIGAINDPEKSYRLELIFDGIEQANDISLALSELGIYPLIAARNAKTVLYLRRSEAIEDFFANIGATSLAFDIMNSKINKELINNANRVTNCDSANINKAIKASNKYNSVILELIEKDKVNLLAEPLKEMALKRIEYKELSFLELGKQFSPPISKSGVHHRLEKILDFYNELKEKNEI